MSERRDHGDFKDYPNLPFEPNCIGFAFHKLGLVREEVYTSPGDYRDLEPWFVVVRSEYEADAVVFTRLTRIWHMAVVDPEDRAYVIQRGATGAEVNREPLQNVCSTYSLGEGFFMIFLKKSFTADC